MLAFLTDAHISPDVAEQIRAKRPEIVIHSLQEWRRGTMLQAEDDAILTAARDEGLTFITYDQRTIAPMVMQWAAQGRDHAGIIFIDEKSIAQTDTGRKVRALLSLWDKASLLEWTNAVSYLKTES